MTLNDNYIYSRKKYIYKIGTKTDLVTLIGEYEF